ncbi:hypothetical protein ACH4VR_40620 [Streptomyces sp. NPDC020883]
MTTTDTRLYGKATAQVSELAVCLLSSRFSCASGALGSYITEY